MTLVLKVCVAALAVSSLAGAALAQASAVTDGPTLFVQNCSACHQPQGQGIPGAFPKLVGDALAVGDPTLGVGVVLNGRGGMPKFSSDLTDQQVSAVLTYVRSSWGNAAPPVQPEVVAAVRGATGAPSPVPGGMQAH